MIDKDVGDVLDVSCLLEEGDGYYVPSLVIELGSVVLSPISKALSACSKSWSTFILS